MEAMAFLISVENVENVSKSSFRVFEFFSSGVVEQVRVCLRGQTRKKIS
mgnify:CR=1 FL=1